MEGERGKGKEGEGKGRGGYGRGKEGGLPLPLPQLGSLDPPVAARPYERPVHYSIHSTHVSHNEKQFRIHKRIR